MRPSTRSSATRSPGCVSDGGCRGTCTSPSTPITRSAASHHQKVVVIDDELAFCGGIDLTGHRWDTCQHRVEEPLRLNSSDEPYEPYHEVQAMVDGPSAAALGTLARDRWRALGKTSLPRLREPDTSLWPEHVPPDLLDVDVMIARTMPGVEDDPEVRENEALFFDAIRAAERTDLPREPVLHEQPHRRGAGGSAAGTRGARSHPRLAEDLSRLARTADRRRVQDGSLPEAAGRGSVQTAASRLSRGIARAGRADVRALQGDDRRRHVRAHRVGEHLQSFHGRGHRVRRGRRSRRQRADARRHPAHPRSAVAEHLHMRSAEVCRDIEHAGSVRAVVDAHMQDDQCLAPIEVHGRGAGCLSGAQSGRGSRSAAE